MAKGELLPRGRQMHIHTKSSHRGIAGRGSAALLASEAVTVAAEDSMVRFFTCC